MRAVFINTHRGSRLPYIFNGAVSYVNIIEVYLVPHVYINIDLGSCTR